MKLLAITIFLSIASLCQSQGLSGIIKDEKGNAVSFVTIYVQEIQSGTTTNRDGKYEISLSPGEYTVTFSSIGYKKETRKVEIKKETELNVVLKSEVYILKEVIVNKSGEDPAYAIMRKTIALAPYHLREVDRYTSEIYLRGTVYMDHVPKFISRHTTVTENGKNFQIKSGDVFTEESVIDIEFTAPDLYRKHVRSLRSSLPTGNSNPVNPELIIGSSFYQPFVMEVISPLSPQAFQHYLFKYEGFVEEGDFFINKIKVIPRRESQDLFDGYLYIVEGKWCLYSVDLSNKQFWGSINVKEMFNRMQAGAWMPVSYTFNVNAAIMGVKARYKYGSSVKYDSIHINKNLVLASENQVSSTKVKTDSSLTEIAKVVSKEDISMKEMRKIAKTLQKENQKTPDTISQKVYEKLTKYEVDSLAKKRDSTYWNQVRSIPLSDEEVTSFREVPFGVMKKDTSQKNDTVKKKERPALWPVSGKRFGGKNSKISFNYKGLLQIDQLGFNTVDGVRYGLTSSLIIKTDSMHSMTIQPWGGYAFSRQAWMWDVTAKIPYSKNSQLKLSAGRQDFDFNMKDGMSPFLNSVYSLLVKDNYKKFYQSEYYSISNEIPLPKGVRFFTQVRFDKMSELDNHTNYSFFNPYKKDYTPNIFPNPKYIPLNDAFYKSFVFDTWLTFSLSGKKDKRLQDENYKTVTLSYSGGFRVLNSITDFHKIGLKLDERLNFSYSKKLSLQISGDYRINNNNSWYPQYIHIRTSYVPVTIDRLDNSFQLLPWYVFDTNKWKAEAHLKYTTKLLLLKRLPIISNRIWNENLYLNYLHSPELNNYFEAGYTLGQIWAVGEFGAFVSMMDWNYRSWGLKVSIALTN